MGDHLAPCACGHRNGEHMTGYGDHLPCAFCTCTNFTPPPATPTEENEE